MHWMIQENLFKESEWETLVSTLDRFAIPYTVVKVVPFVGEIVPEPPADLKNVICFGSYSMRHAAKKYGWTPGVYDLEPFDFTKQLERWGDRMLNADAQVVRFEDVVFDDIAFLRPILDSKSFAGKVFTWEEFSDWQHKVCELEHDYGNSLTKDTLVQVCHPKVIYSEYRFWIVDRQIVTYSRYKRGDKIWYDSHADEHVIRFAHECILNGDLTLGARTVTKQPHDAYVLDVCETPDGMKIVEVNTINCAGFYAGNMPALILALEDMENAK
jgi:hypothetical protein